MSATETRNEAFSIVTYTGKRVWPTDMRVEDVDPMDIAHALSVLCRYNGHVEDFYSVAQHECIMFDLGVKLGLPPTSLAQIVFHDGTEAYCGDMVAPLKHQEEFQFYCDIEEKIWAVIAERFDLDVHLDPHVHELDLAIREAEIRDLKGGIGHSINRWKADKFGKITPWLPKLAKKNLLWRMRSIGIEV